MRKRKVTIRSLSHEVSLRKCPWEPECDEQITKTLKPNETLEIDLDSRVYDWKDNQFFEAYQHGVQIGYINASAITLD